MRCDDVQLALSARLDGEDPGLPDADLDRHLATCAACAAWLARAEQVTRAVRVQPVAVPDLTDSIMEAVATDRAATAAAAARSQGAQRGKRQILRVAVALTAVAQLAVAVPDLLFSLGMPGGQPHTTHELASFDIALAIGFLFAAYRPAVARAYLPMAFALAACLAVTGAFDVSDGEATLAQETLHVVAVIQALLLWGLDRADRPYRLRPRETT